MGTNPLPDFVVAEYFLTSHNIKNIYLLYSEETPKQKSTKNYAENLQNLIKKRHQYKNCFISLIPLSDISSAKALKKDINERLLPTLSPQSSVHLNYTGGTKAMGIHVYRMIEDLHKENKIKKASFSYLDARSFKLIDDEIGKITDDLRNTIRMTMEEILNLHGYRRINEKDSDNLFDSAIKVFEELINENRLEEYYKAYKRDKFCKEGTSELIKKNKEISEELKGFKAENPLLRIVLTFPQEFRIFNDDGSFCKPATNNHLKKAIEFLDGGWLEGYLYKILKEEDSFKEWDIEKNWEIYNQAWKTGQRFEIDISVVKGYQLIGISCTTSDVKSICKSKGFEILHRTRQMGGEEARAVLVTGLKKELKDELEAELAIDTGGRENILVLGKEDLKREIFIEKLKSFIE